MSTEAFYKERHFSTQLVETVRQKVRSRQFFLKEKNGFSQKEIVSVFSTKQQN